jgi:hypothetical protein
LHGTLGRLFQTSRKARTLLLDGFELEAFASGIKKNGDEVLRDMADSSRRLLFADQLNDVIDTISHDSELKMIRDSASMLESGRSKDFEVAVIGIATVIGGAAGAIASIILR